MVSLIFYYIIAISLESTARYAKLHKEKNVNKEPEFGLSDSDNVSIIFLFVKEIRKYEIGTAKKFGGNKKSVIQNEIQFSQDDTVMMEDINYNVILNSIY